MKAFVVDSSVVIKWFLPEVGSTTAIRLQTIGVLMHAPDFLDVEAGRDYLEENSSRWYFQDRR